MVKINLILSSLGSLVGFKSFEAWILLIKFYIKYCVGTWIYISNCLAHNCISDLSLYIQFITYVRLYLKVSFEIRYITSPLFDNACSFFKSHVGLGNGLWLWSWTILNSRVSFWGLSCAQGPFSSHGIRARPIGPYCCVTQFWTP